MYYINRKFWEQLFYVKYFQSFSITYNICLINDWSNWSTPWSCNWEPHKNKTMVTCMRQQFLTLWLSIAGAYLNKLTVHKNIPTKSRTLPWMTGMQFPVRRSDGVTDALCVCCWVKSDNTCCMRSGFAGERSRAERRTGILVKDSSLLCLCNSSRGLKEIK